LVTTRILTQRRLLAAHSEPAVRRRRSQRQAHRELDARGLLARLRFGAFGRIYVAAGLLLIGVTLYLLQATHVTQASYEIQRLRAQQADLVAERDQLGYREASLKAPARVEQEAQQAGMQRAAPSRYVPYLASTVDLRPRPASPPADDGLAWRGAAAAAVRAITGSQDVSASER
jgi:cell division protein FtsL